MIEYLITKNKYLEYSDNMKNHVYFKPSYALLLKFFMLVMKKMLYLHLVSK